MKDSGTVDRAYNCFSKKGGMCITINHMVAVAPQDFAEVLFCSKMAKEDEKG
jgi:hypothetical protein